MTEEGIDLLKMKLKKPVLEIRLRNFHLFMFMKGPTSQLKLYGAIVYPEYVKVGLQEPKP